MTHSKGRFKIAASKSVWVLTPALAVWRSAAVRGDNRWNVGIDWLCLSVWFEVGR